MKNILKYITLIAVGCLITVSCDYDNSNFKNLSGPPDANATYYVQFKANAQNLEVLVVPATGETIEEIETTIVVAILGLPLAQDITVNLTVDPSSTATSDMYILGSTSLVIQAGTVSASTTVTSVSENMPVGDPVNLVLTIDLGANNAPAGTTLNYEMLRPAPCVPKSGDYKVIMSDSFGDGWQTSDGDSGDGITVTLEDAGGIETVIEVGMCSYWAGSAFACTEWPAEQAPGACGANYCFKGPIEAIVTIPEGTQKMFWYFPGDEFGEISFKVNSPSGTELFNSGGAGDFGAGEIEVINCQ